MADDGTVDTGKSSHSGDETVSTGSQLGAYRLIRKIGAGGMGSVWLAEHVKLQRRAAIKLLRRDAAADAETVTRFFNEARAATAIADPGIVQIFDYGHHDDGSAYIVMELLDGETLDARQSRLGRLPYADALRLMRQVASSLGAAHAHGIIHRDLKPQNLYIVRDPEVPGGERTKILDFGIAKLLRDDVGLSTDTHAFMGTPLYMAPEQCRDAGAVDERSDVYALGCVLFLLVTGRTAFGAANLAEMLTKHLYEPAPRASSLVPDLPPAIDDLIARCLAKDPADRFASGTELAEAIVAVTGLAPYARAHATGETDNPVRALDPAPVGVETTLSRTSGAVTVPRLPPASSRRTVVVAAAIGILGVAAATAMLVSNLRQESSLSSRRAASPTVEPIIVPIDAAVAAPPIVETHAVPVDGGLDASPVSPQPATEPPTHSTPKRHRRPPPSGSATNADTGDRDHDGIPDTRDIK